MKRLFILGLIAWVFLSGCTVNYNFGSNEAVRFSGYDEFERIKSDLDSDFDAVEETLEVKEKDIDSLEVGTISGDIEIIYEDRETALIHYYGFFSEKDSEPDYRTDDKGAVKFDVNWNNLKGPHFTEMKVYLPENLKVSMKVASVSGNIEGEKVESESLKINTVSGNIKIGEMDAKDIALETVSGESEVSNMIAGYAKIDSVSGNISIKSQLDSCDIDTTSGSIDLQITEQLGDVALGSVSGDVNLVIETYNAALDLDTVSGDIDVNLEMNSVKKKDHSLIGEIGLGQYDINIKTVSGDIELK